MDTQTKAKKAAILKLMYGFPSSHSRITEEIVEAYTDAVAAYSAEAVGRACERFLQGEVPGQNIDYLPSVPSVVGQVRLHDQIVGSVTAKRELERMTKYAIGTKPPPGYEPLGPTKLELDGRVRDVSHLTLAEKETAIRTGRMPVDRPQLKEIQNG